MHLFQRSSNPAPRTWVGKDLEYHLYSPSSDPADIASFVTQVVRLGTAGVTPVVSGSMGESTHLSHEERVTLIITARTALNAVGLESMPIIAGTGAGSTRETIELCRQAGKAGADYAMVIISGYFAGALAGNRKALKDFWVDVSENSPIPILIYNCEFGVLDFRISSPLILLAQDPAASGGIDLDSDLIVELAITCPNICGVKLT
jgi:4-hydroxy-2-oxoglutarate aldolase